jgi:hypothetical protein
MMYLFGAVSKLTHDKIVAKGWKGLNNIQSVNDTGNVTQDGQTDVDEEISAASSLEEDTQRGKENGEDDFADIPIVDRMVRAAF